MENVGQAGKVFQAEADQRRDRGEPWPPQRF